MEREFMEFDVVIVGAGPSGLSAACRLKQKAAEAGQELSVCVVEKGSEVGAHILSGAVFEPRALNELFPNWKELGAPLNTEVKRDDIYLLKSEEKGVKVPNFFVPKTMHNEGNYIISLGNLCRWLAQQAEALGVEIYPGFAAQEALIDENGVVRGIITGDLGVDREGHPKEGYYTPGMELRGKYTLFAEGCRGHIGKQLIKKFNLDSEADAQHYGIGIKEIWDIDPAKHEQGLVVHTAGWPLSDENPGGSFLYHLENNQVVVGLIVDLSYSNPFLSPFDEFQRYKHHPVIAQYLEGGKRVAYGARAICKGGLNSLPKMVFPGGALIGCDLGTLNFAKIKGSHTAMKSGMLAAEAVADVLLADGQGGDLLNGYVDGFKASWLYDELFRSRNFGAAIHKFGAIAGGAFNFIDQNIFGGKITTFRKLAEHAMQRLAPHFPTMKGDWTAGAVMPGGDLPDGDPAAFMAQLAQEYPWLPRDLARYYTRTYGTLTRELIGQRTSVAQLGRRFGPLLYEAEARYLTAREWAETAEDILWRRTKHQLHMTADEQGAFAEWFISTPQERTA